MGKDWDEAVENRALPEEALQPIGEGRVEEPSETSHSHVRARAVLKDEALQDETLAGAWPPPPELIDDEETLMQTLGWTAPMEQLEEARNTRSPPSSWPPPPDLLDEGKQMETTGLQLRFKEMATLRDEIAQPIASSWPPSPDKVAKAQWREAVKQAKADQRPSALGAFLQRVRKHLSDD